MLEKVIVYDNIVSTGWPCHNGIVLFENVCYEIILQTVQCTKFKKYQLYKSSAPCGCQEYTSYCAVLHKVQLKILPISLHGKEICNSIQTHMKIW